MKRWGPCGDACLVYKTAIFHFPDCGNYLKNIVWDPWGSYTQIEPFVSTALAHLIERMSQWNSPSRRALIISPPAAMCDALPLTESHMLALVSIGWSFRTDRFSRCAYFFPKKLWEFTVSQAMYETGHFPTSLLVVWTVGLSFILIFYFKLFKSSWTYFGVHYRLEV